MKFHNYKTMKPSDWRGTTQEYISEVMRCPTSCETRDEADTARAAIEMGWFGCERPFYNVYPIAVDLCLKTSLGMRWGDILFPQRYLCLRFAEGHEPLRLKSCLSRVPSKASQSTVMEFHESRFRYLSSIKSTPLASVFTIEGRESCNFLWMYPGRDIANEVVCDTVSHEWERTGDAEVDDTKHQAQFLIRLLAFIGLLARGTDLITPAILAADREEYDATTDEARKRWLEARAAKRQGVGFDIGRSMEIERATSPHWRCPHLALFHTGPGRTVPVLKVRSGCVVIPRDMSHVPTGYMGAEKPGEPEPERKIVFRTPVPKKMRFRVFRRDNYRCRLCGMTSQDGVRLECDHIVPVAKGGKTIPANLWTLCQPCNSGKSDSDLHKAIEDNKATGGKAVNHGV